MIWLKDNAPVIGALAGILIAFVAVLQLVVTGPVTNRFDDLRSEMNQRLNDLRSEMNQRFDQQDKHLNARFDVVEQRLDRLEGDVSELRTLDDRISRNEGRIDLLTEQLQAVPAPSR